MTSKQARAQAKAAGLHKVTVDGDELHVPMAGSKLRTGRAARQTTRAVAYASLAFLLVGGAVGGGLLGVALLNRPTSQPISDADKVAYGLDNFNTSAASAFADEYIRQCLTRTADGKYPETRAVVLSSMATVADPACATSGEAQPRGIGKVVWTGASQKVPGISNARYLTFDVGSNDGTRRYTLPVNLADPVTGAGPRIVGTLGMVPAAWPQNPTPDARYSAGDTDTALASSLAESFLPDFFSAWAGTQSTLPQFLTGSASQAARAGLGGQLSEPLVQQVIAYVPTGMTAGTYPDQTKVPLDVTLTAVDSGRPTSLSYRVTVQVVAGKWFVSDISGGLAVLPTDSQPSAPPANIPTSTPTPTPSR